MKEALSRTLQTSMTQQKLQEQTLCLRTSLIHWLWDRGRKSGSRHPSDYGTPGGSPVRVYVRAVLYSPQHLHTYRSSASSAVFSSASHPIMYSRHFFWLQAVVLHTSNSLACLLALAAAECAALCCPEASAYSCLSPCRGFMVASSEPNLAHLVFFKNCFSMNLTAVSPRSGALRETEQPRHISWLQAVVLLLMGAAESTLNKLTPHHDCCTCTRCSSCRYMHIQL